MSKHIARAERWARTGPNEHRSAIGRVYFRAGQWHATVTYTVTDPEDPALPRPQTWTLGKFKRPRNAMMAVEEKVLELQRKHGPLVTFVHPAETVPG